MSLCVSLCVCGQQRQRQEPALHGHATESSHAHNVVYVCYISKFRKLCSITKIKGKDKEIADF